MYVSRSVAIENVCQIRKGWLAYTYTNLNGAQAFTPSNVDFTPETRFERRALAVSAKAPWKACTILLVFGVMSPGIGGNKGFLRHSVALCGYDEMPLGVILERSQPQQNMPVEWNSIIVIVEGGREDRTKMTSRQSVGRWLGTVMLVSPPLGRSNEIRESSSDMISDSRIKQLASDNIRSVVLRRDAIRQRVHAKAMLEARGNDSGWLR
ncbi:hypothetical protein DL93DRAFT_2095387 [Clavulina sp. PMI_390]|nr:hypothetical protein DL93DRAFT_2095387 [Clavulina sp. PMI_390]